MRKPTQKLSISQLKRRLCLTVPEAARVSGIGVQTLRNAVNSGELESIRIVTQKRIPTAVLKAYVRRNKPARNKPDGPGKARPADASSETPPTRS